LSIAQKIDHSALGVAKENTLTIGEQMQTGAARNQVGQVLVELAAQQKYQLANALQAEATLTKITEHG
jgi:hypothetical protein